MTRYVALLRGIAPSLPNHSNAGLRGVLERLGATDVGSVLASGNIVFTSDVADAVSLEQRIEDALTADLGLSSRALVRSGAELRTLVGTDPFPGLVHGSGTYLTATFVKDPATVPGVLPERLDAGTHLVGYDPTARAVLAVTDNSSPDRARGYLRWLDATFGKGATTRSWLTVGRIADRLGA